MTETPGLMTAATEQDTAASPLDGIRVVALEHAVAAPLCSRHLADLGADVVKVEPPAGDLARHYDSVVNGQATYFVWANRGKRSVVLDLKSVAGKKTFEQLLGSADVFVHNLGPGAVDRLGFDRDTLRQRLPRLVNCAISGYGVDGPYRNRKAFDLLIQSEAGLLSVTGGLQQPAKAGVSVADMCAAVYAVAAIVAALRRRDATGSGGFIDISMLDCLSEWMMPPAYYQLYAGTQLPRSGARHNMVVPYGVYPTGGDEHVNFAVQTASQWRRLCEKVLDDPELADDPRFATNELRVRHRGELEPMIEAKLSDLGTAKATELLLAAGIPMAAVNDLNGLVTHPQHEARGRWTFADSPGGPVRVLRSPFNMEGTVEYAGAIPGLGEHTGEVLAELRGKVVAGEEK
ncbi:CaiB/BaiF CoA transferase family protein [Amycolatopsis sp. cmx-8-4]|uniref:CaiB/BaiF CoA transferase family protein n=1 Tax=Amycolatopsis sp. cmx-8-4 TaxID=2790947 RepID=UPI00397B8A7D